MHMKAKYTLFRRNGVYYSQDSATGQQKSLRTRDEAEAQELVNARNEAHQQPALNLHLARAYPRALPWAVMFGAFSASAPWHDAHYKRRATASRVSH